MIDQQLRDQAQRLIRELTIMHRLIQEKTKESGQPTGEAIVVGSDCKRLAELLRGSSFGKVTR